MIYLYDNGGEYSAHEVSFIESDYPESEHVVALLEAEGRVPYSGNKPRVLGVSASVSWREPGSTTPLSERVAPRSFFGGNDPLDEPCEVRTPHPGFPEEWHERQLVPGREPARWKTPGLPARPDTVERLRRDVFDACRPALLEHLFVLWTGPLEGEGADAHLARARQETSLPYATALAREHERRSELASGTA